MALLDDPADPAALLARSRSGFRIDVRDISARRGGQTVLRDVTFAIEPGQVVAIVGASGAGKSTLLDAIAGVRHADEGDARLDGVSVRQDGSALRHLIGYVPQDDLMHRDLPVAATLRYAALLRLPDGTPEEEVEAVVGETLTRLDLVERAGQRVADLSGGQRKRTSIGVELLTRPRAFFLDEPTSGLDPATAAGLMGTLRDLAAQGTTVVFTTHNTDDLRSCDRMVVVADGGIAFIGSPAEALRYFEVDHLADIYLRGATTARSASTAISHQPAAPTRTAHATLSTDDGDERPSAVAQWAALTRRNLDILRHNRLTLAIMLGAPALVIAMFAMLFQPGALDPSQPDPAAAVSTTYWMAFAAFFFGLTYGLLQICTELPIVRRERFVGLRIGSYLTAKVTVLAPVLLIVNLSMVAVLRALDRLPASDAATYARLSVTLMITALAALALGLLASAAVSDPAQATLALPMLCFPAVLFAGAVLPVPAMEIGGRSLSILVIARWSFEAIGHDLGLTQVLAGDRSGAGATLLAQYGETFNHGAIGHWAILTLFAVTLFAATAAVLRRRTSPPSK